jgi:hypothetical protein
MLARLAAPLLALAALARGAVLVDFQVAAPPNVPAGAKTCQVTVVECVVRHPHATPSCSTRAVQPHVRELVLRVSSGARCASARDY